MRDCAGLDITQIPTIKAVIDTNEIAQNVFNFTRENIPLKQVMYAVGLPVKHMHNAGNDARYTLQALLLMFCNYKQQVLHYECISENDSQSATDMQLMWECQLEVLEKIGRTIVEHVPVYERKPIQRHRLQEPDLLVMDLGSSDDSIVTLFEND